MSRFPFSLLFLLFCFSMLEHSRARYLSSSDSLHKSSKFQGEQMEVVVEHFFQDNDKSETFPLSDSTAAANVGFQANVPQKLRGVSLVEKPPVQQDRTGNQNNKQKGQLQPNDTMLPSFDYSDYSRPKTRPPSHN